MDALTSTDDREELRALLLLDATPGVGLRRLKAAVAVLGSGRAVWAASDRDLRRFCGPAAVQGRRDPEVPRRVERALVAAERVGMTIVTWTDVPYPRCLHQLADPPPVLFLHGKADLLGVPAVTIVGARRATARARDVAHRLAMALARVSMPVVSGMALGIDGAAHRGALDGGGDTIAVLGGGADRASPASHVGLFRDIVARGLVVSEFMPGTLPLPHHFPRRNRILAGLGHTIVVVEASRKSGSLITVEHALDLGRDVYAVPGPIEQPLCAGSNELLADGARPLTAIDRFVAAVGGGDQTELPIEALPGGAAGDLLRRLTEAPTHVEEIASTSAIPVHEALSTLTQLELGGWVEQVSGLRFRRAG